ncbi:putative PurR-regulated permease PerM [Aliiruegeria haliotis]|uniref:Putative PurR-regulated permease PerM n=1 Tax=Aliiruegeria haliotis TaxID=1280846 RepID=A0A2T0RPU8_9RHOB|nr:AI-2E family transporter [Aliiruegeria haliotis]PRY23130.1 putative PurR-regulated permease PerM [Aliiruegeria haliotis]
MTPLARMACIAQIALAILAMLAVFWASQQILAPVVLALVVGVVFAPLVDLARSAGVPRSLAAFSGLLLVAMLIGLFVLFMDPYVRELVRRAPILWEEAQGAIENLRNLLRGVEEMAETVNEALKDEGDTESAGGDQIIAPDEALPDVATALGYAPALAGQALVFVGTLFFFLLSRDEIYELVERATQTVDSHRLRKAEARVSRYFLTISVINAGLGILVAVTMSALGMPSPVLWGVLAFLFNFAPYLGPAIFASALAVAGILTFDGIAGILPMAAYLALNVTEGQFVTPTLVGHSMTINPLLVFLSLTIWLWLWGPIGGIVAIPLLVWTLSMTGWQLGLPDGPAPRGSETPPPA